MEVDACIIPFYVLFSGGNQGERLQKLLHQVPTVQVPGEHEDKGRAQPHAQAGHLHRAADLL